MVSKANIDGPAESFRVSDEVTDAVCIGRLA
jgi:hypothetical protein